MKKEIVYMDLFSGTGGFAKGLLLAGFSFKQHYFSETDSYAIANYQYNFKNSQSLGDIKKIQINKIQRPNIITFGSPCQDISIAGKIKGINGKRSRLFFEALRIISKLKPDAFIFENVKGLFSSNEGKDFEKVLRAFADIGLYDIEWQLLNTNWFLPQNRERVYVVGHLRGKARQQIFPLKRGFSLSKKKSKDWEVCENFVSTITASYRKSVSARGETFINSIKIPVATKKGFEIAEPGDCINLSYLSSKSRRGRVSKGTSHTLTTNGYHHVLNNGVIRRLTPLECERLQGFPDQWTEKGFFDGEEKEISDTQRYTLLGNAVSVPVVKAIANKLLKYSFKSNNGFSLNGIEESQTHKALPKNLSEFVTLVEKDLRVSHQHNKLSIEKLARSLNITDRTEIKELTELAIVNVARELASTNETTHQKFENLVKLYNSQVNLSHRTSQSILLQQYSTPCPIAYLMGVFCNLDQLGNGEAFEPSAGNGLLTIAGQANKIVVNEIDSVRNRNLRTQGFKSVTNKDASKPFSEFYREFDAVITNPPFGRLDHAMQFDSYPIRILDHAMSLLALDTMADSGRAAIIIGGHSGWDSNGRLQKGKNRLYFNYLYHNYNVKDVIAIDGKYLYKRQGTGVPVRLILIAGRKTIPHGVAPLKNETQTEVINTFEGLYNRVMQSVEIKSTEMNLVNLKKKAEELRKRLGLDEELGAPYLPASTSKTVLNTQVPDSMSFETQSALNKIKLEVGGDIDNFVRHRLGYATKNSLFQVLSAEQIDAVAMAIYNIEAKGQGMIIGDQTGIGKGRVAASMIRYGVKRGLKPIFLTEKANLFSDIYRDLDAIGSANLKPFIINSRETKTEIKNEDGEVIYEALPANEQNNIFESGEVPETFDYVVATYTQFNSPVRKSTKPNFLKQIAEGNIMIMDEAHNSSGSSNTGTFMQSVVRSTLGIVFLSATFAKRPDNMPIYAMKTSISEANLSKEGLVRAILSGGVALQEILSSQLVAEGQMIRRERSFEGIEVNYITLDKYETEHKKTSDKITNILRYIIAFQEEYVERKIKSLDEEVAAEGKQAAARGGTNQAGVDNIPYFSKVFNVINQMLFSIKAEAVADRAIERLKEGKKPVIAFSSTMGSFIEQMENEDGQPVSDGDSIRIDFAEVLRKGLDGVLRYTVYDVDGKASYESFNPSELGPQAEEDYLRIREEIDNVSTGISISPIDVVINKLEAAGYTVAEVTGRKFKVEINGESGIVSSRKKLTTNDAFRKFNNNEIDVLMINQSGSTGASAHAIPTSKVPPEKVKQRVMIILQAELDINTEVQKWGRINRTGQILKPIYDYVTSAIPAERRLMMMAQMKLKSLDANTTSNQKQSNNILNVPDFLNKYGDKVVGEYLQENPLVNKLLDYPLSAGETNESTDDKWDISEAANKVAGRVAVLSTRMQTDFYTDITERYNDYVEYMKQIGEYDLEVEAIDLKAETLERTIIKMGKGGDSAFGEDSFLEKVEANILKKPFKAKDVETLIVDSLEGKTAKEHKEEFIHDLTKDFRSKIKSEEQEIHAKYEKLIENIPNEKKLQKLKDTDVNEFLDSMEERKKQLTKEWQDELNSLLSGKSSKEQYVRRIFEFFSIGRKLAYPAYPKSMTDTVMGICLGVSIDKKRKNPYAKSAIKIKIAIANGNKYVSIPASRSEDINKIIAFSHDLRTSALTDLLIDWESEIKTRTKDRGIRYIITGNLLQAFNGEDGKLVSYTTSKGEIKKGILLPEDWKQLELGKQKVTVPIIQALKLLKELSVGNTLHASDSLSFIKIVGGYRIIVPSSRSKGGDIYMDQDIWPLIENNKFETVGDKMLAILPDKNITQLAEILQDKLSVSIDLNLNQLAIIENSRKQKTEKKKIELPPPEDSSEQNRLRIVKIRAKALALKYKLNIAA